MSKARHRRKRKRKKTAHDRRRENDRKYFKKHPELKPNYCQDCGKINVPLQFHHERYDIPRCGRFLCEECHMKIHGIKPNWQKRKMRKNNKYWKLSNDNSHNRDR